MASWKIVRRTGPGPHVLGTMPVMFDHNGELVTEDHEVVAQAQLFGDMFEIHPLPESQGEADPAAEQGQVAAVMEQQEADAAAKDESMTKDQADVEAMPKEQAHDPKAPDPKAATHEQASRRARP